MALLDSFLTPYTYLMPDETELLCRSSAATWQNAVVETCVTGSTVPKACQVPTPISQQASFSLSEVGLLQIAVDETHAKTPPGRRTPGIGAVQGLEATQLQTLSCLFWQDAKSLNLFCGH